MQSFIPNHIYRAYNTKFNRTWYGYYIKTIHSIHQFSFILAESGLPDRKPGEVFYAESVYTHFTHIGNSSDHPEFFL